MTKLLISLLGAGVLATGGWAAATSLESDPARTVSLSGATTAGETTTTSTTTNATTTARTTAEDVSGPCDEAEHRNDPRCSAASVPAPVLAPARTTTGDDGDDHRRGGDHDHGDDHGDDRSGPGGGDDEDRSGSNSGQD